MGELREEVLKLRERLYGNGTPGLVEMMAVIERDITFIRADLGRLNLVAERFVNVERKVAWIAAVIAGINVVGIYVVKFL